MRMARVSPLQKADDPHRFSAITNVAMTILQNRTDFSSPAFSFEPGRVFD